MLFYMKPIKFIVSLPDRVRNIGLHEKLVYATIADHSPCKHETWVVIG